MSSNKQSRFRNEAKERLIRKPKNQWAKLAGASLVLIRGRAEGAELTSARHKMAYELVSLLGGVGGGALAGAMFSRIWGAVSDDGEAPEPTALDRSVSEVLIASALQGVIFGVVKAVFDRIIARGYRQLTGDDPER
ncbi:MAG: DUF4235 domain-containing protein [Pseudonocardiaceae bacterium]